MTHCHGVKKYCLISNTLSELCCTCGENAFMTRGHFMGNCNLQSCQFFLSFSVFERSHKPGQARVSVAFRAVGYIAPVFSGVRGP